MPLKGGKGRAGVLHIGNLQQPGNQRLNAQAGNIKNGQIFRKLVGGDDARDEQNIIEKGHGRFLLYFTRL